MGSLVDRPLELSAIRKEGSPEWRLLNDLQGNILKFHGRRFAIHLFLNFADSNGAKARLRAMSFDSPVDIPIGITSALRQIIEGEAYRKSDGRQSTHLLSMSLSYEGYRALGIPADRIPNDPAFREGMQERGPTWLGDDPSTEHWENHFKQPVDDQKQPIRERAIHGMLLLTGNDRDALEHLRDQLQAALGPTISVIGEEFGEQLYDREYGPQARPIEHFGYVDNISSPIFFVEDQPSSAAHWNPLTPAERVLERCAGSSDFGYGSYLVFRKLEQNVKRFVKMQEEVASTLCLPGPHATDVAGALIIGRFKGGRPALRPESSSDINDFPESSSDINDFDFSGDETGTQCPFAAHIRKVNPRGSSDSTGRRDRVLADERRHTIARRGITYGVRKDLLQPDLPSSAGPEVGVGLLFMCYQRSVIEQFEHLQRTWANNEFFPILPSRARVGRDLLIGQGGVRTASLPARCEGLTSRNIELGNCVTLKGGEFFFTPSISFFRSL
jgi:Dyp-type peroxidase family